VRGKSLPDGLYFGFSDCGYAADKRASIAAGGPALAPIGQTWTARGSFRRVWSSQRYGPCRLIVKPKPISGWRKRAVALYAFGYGAWGCSSKNHAVFGTASLGLATEQKIAHPADIRPSQLNC
jgi:hypothetical protein